MSIAPNYVTFGDQKLKNGDVLEPCSLKEGKIKQFNLGEKMEVGYGC